MPRLSIHLLGRFEVLLDGAPVGGFAYNKLRALLAYLAVESARPQTRAHLAALLWPDVPERLARQNLSQGLRMLRKLLGEHDSSAAMTEPFLLISSDMIQLNPLADCTVDTTCFAALLAMAEAHQHRAMHLCAACIDRLRQAVALYQGDLLALAGRPAEALGQYELLCAILAQGAEPEPQTTALRDQIRKLTLGAYVALRRFSPPPGNLPAPHMPPLGRARELEEVCMQLREGPAGILTIVGAAGSGKTRLALEAGRALRFAFADGVWLIELAPLDDPAQVLPVIAQTLAEPSEALAASLRERHLLLVLDGFERVLDAAPAVAALLAACPMISVLATSRAPLRVRAERRYDFGVMKSFLGGAVGPSKPPHFSSFG